MNGVRRFLGGGGSSTQPPPPQPPPPASPSPSPVTPPPPPPASSKPSWPSQDSRPSTPTDGKSTSTGGTPGLVIRKERPKPTQVASPTNEKTPGIASVQSPRSVSTPTSARSPLGSITSYNVTSPTRRLVPNGTSSILGSPTPSSSRVAPPGLAEPMTSESSASVEWKHTSGLVNIRDELLVSLLTSEAVVDSRECEILSAEEVEELKKVHAIKLPPTLSDASF